MGCVWVYRQKVELHYWWEYGDEKTAGNKFGGTTSGRNDGRPGWLVLWIWDKK